MTRILGAAIGNLRNLDVEILDAARVGRIQAAAVHCSVMPRTLFEEVQFASRGKRWLVGLAWAAALAASAGSLTNSITCIALMAGGVRRFGGMVTTVDEEGLRIQFPFGRGQKSIRFDQIVKWEVVRYQTGGFWRGVGAPGLESPSCAIRVQGNRGVRLDLNDGLHLLIGSQEPERLAALIAEHRIAVSTVVG
jgi:hypothetical protein